MLLQKSAKNSADQKRPDMGKSERHAPGSGYEPHDRQARQKRGEHEQKESKNNPRQNYRENSVSDATRFSSPNKSCN